jgi:hypothetical protein
MRGLVGRWYSRGFCSRETVSNSSRAAICLKRLPLGPDRYHLDKLALSCPNSVFCRSYIAMAALRPSRARPRSGRRRESGPHGSGRSMTSQTVSRSRRLAGVRAEGLRAASARPGGRCPRPPTQPRPRERTQGGGRRRVARRVRPRGPEVFGWLADADSSVEALPSPGGSRSSPRTTRPVRSRGYSDGPVGRRQKAQPAGKGQGCGGHPGVGRAKRRARLPREEDSDDERRQRRLPEMARPRTGCAPTRGRGLRG